MRVYLTWLLAILASSSTMSVRAAMAEQSSGDTASTSEYNALVARAQKLDSTVDYGDLRWAYTRTKAYSPDKGEAHDRAAKMWSAFDQDRLDEALKEARAVLELEFVNIDAHVVSSTIYRGRDDSTHAYFHNILFGKLVESILHSGDGKSKKSAYKVISVAEEKPVLGVLGLSAHGQSLVIDNGNGLDLTPESKCYDKIETVDKNGHAAGAVWFDITVPYAFDYFRLKEALGDN
jgi:hypothetical protein